MNSAVFFQTVIPAGTTDISPIISVPVNGFIMQVPSSKNVYITKISFILTVVSRPNVVPKFYSIRFRLRNRDISLNINLAGNILNPISGAWNGSLPKDSICDIMLSSKKNFIEFKTPILAGGLQFQTLRYINNSPNVLNTTITSTIIIDYYEQ
jgi:hypothetical protein